MSYESMLTAGKSKKTYCNVIQEVRTEDGQGGYTRTWAILHRRLLCRFNAMKDNEIQILWDKQSVQANYAVYLKYVSGIKENYRLVKLDDSREFEVKLTMNWDEDNSMLKLACLEVARLA